MSDWKPGGGSGRDAVLPPCHRRAMACWAKLGSSLTSHRRAMAASAASTSSLSDSERRRC
eukprot:scaffold77958_cov27-Phaeocystis_antarctica.AAC.1